MVRSLVCFAALLGAPALAEAESGAVSPPAPAGVPVADWSRPTRWFIRSEVHLPAPMWFATDNNLQARVLAWQLHVVLDCDGGQTETRRVREVRCAIPEVALQAASYEADHGQLPRILPEMVDKLRRGVVQLQVRDDGRVLNVDLDGLPREHVRMARITENLRLIVARAVAGFDAPVPRHGEAQWVQYTGMLLQVPSDEGSSAGMEIIHELRGLRPDGALRVETQGHGTSFLWDGNSTNAWSVDVAANAVFDGAGGGLLARKWIVVGDPTPGSPMAKGFAGIPYLQQGRLTRLAPGEVVDVGPTEERALPGAPTDTLLPAWTVLGAVPGPVGQQPPSLVVPDLRGTAPERGPMIPAGPR